jgi:hypothetical protein
VGPESTSSSQRPTQRKAVGRCNDGRVTGCIPRQIELVAPLSIHLVYPIAATSRINSANRLSFQRTCVHFARTGPRFTADETCVGRREARRLLRYRWSIGLRSQGEHQGSPRDVPGAPTLCDDGLQRRSKRVVRALCSLTQMRQLESPRKSHKRSQLHSMRSASTRQAVVLAGTVNDRSARTRCGLTSVARRPSRRHRGRYVRGDSQAEKPLSLRHSEGHVATCSVSPPGLPSAPGADLRSHPLCTDFSRGGGTKGGTERSDRIVPVRRALIVGLAFTCRDPFEGVPQPCK